MTRANPLAVLVCGLLVLAGCQPTQLSTSWRDPAAATLSFKKVVVVVLHSTPAERRAQEDALVEQIKRATAVASYTFIPDADLRDKEKATQLIRQQGCDGAVVVRLLAADKQTTYTVSSGSDWGPSWSLAPSFDTRVSSYTDTIIRAEISLYSVADGKLIWAGASDTANPASARDLAMQVGKAASAELRKQGLIPN